MNEESKDQVVGQFVISIHGDKGVHIGGSAADAPFYAAALYAFAEYVVLRVGVYFPDITVQMADAVRDRMLAALKDRSIE
jgi:hypothetical protein